MKLEELEQLAKDAIAKFPNRLIKSVKKPIVEIGNSRPLPEDFPIPLTYLGCNRWGKHIYHLDAEAVLQYVERYRREFL